MINKLLSVFIGAVLWGLGTYFNVLVAIGTYGLLAFIAGVILALGLLIRNGFQENRSSTELWILIFRGLAVEALLFPIANLINLYLLHNSFPSGQTRSVLIASGLISAILAGVFLFNARLLKTKIGQMHTRLKENGQDEEVGLKPGYASSVDLVKESMIIGHEE